MGRYPAVVVFAYNRPKHLETLLTSLERAEGATDTEVWVFCDGSKEWRGDDENVVMTREVASREWKFASVRRVFREKNVGLAANIIGGLNEVFEKDDRVVVLEDDLEVSKGLLTYMRAALEKYEKMAVLSVAAYTPKLRQDQAGGATTYAMMRNCSWGWGTWKDRWKAVDWEVKDFGEFAKDRERQRAFDRAGSDLSAMLLRWKTGEINSWSIRFCYSGFKRGLTTIYPVMSMVRNGGADGSGTNVGRTGRYETEMVERIDTGRMTDDLTMDGRICEEFERTYGCSWVRRMINRVKWWKWRREKGERML